MNTASHLNTASAAQYLSLSPRTLEKYRLTGEGPPYYKVGSRCLYKLEELEAWLSTKRCASTSDAHG